MIRIGVRSFVSAGGGTDADAQAFITAAGITDATQQSAINTLVTDLKGYSIWSKMKAIYPFVGGTASTHKWNLKDPRDLDAAFRLVFAGGWTHSSTGALPNGTNGYANSYFVANTLSSSSVHLSYYSRTDTAAGDKCEIGSQMAPAITPNYEASLLIKHSSNLSYPILGYSLYPSVSNTNSQGFYVARRNDSTNVILDKNGSKILTGAQTTTLPPYNIYLGAQNRGDSAIFRYTDRECAFASIGDGLTDTETANFYTAVQKYQTTLGRSVGTQTVSDADAQAFVDAAVIQDQVQATAVNKLVTDLKGYGIWSKMKAIYPFVGGTASSHKWNLKDPRDLDAAYRLVFSGGWTHNANGATPNGTNGYADTFLTPSTSISQNSAHLSFYSRTNSLGNGMNIGSIKTFPPLQGLHMAISFGLNSNQMRTRCNSENASTSYTPTDTRGLFSISRTTSTQYKGYKNDASVFTFTETSNSPSDVKIVIGAINTSAGVDNYSTNECAFASIGDGLTDTEAANLYTAVQAYQTTLSRNV